MYSLARLGLARASYTVDQTQGQRLGPVQNVVNDGGRQCPANWFHWSIFATGQYFKLMVVLSARLQNPSFANKRSMEARKVDLLLFERQSHQIDGRSSPMAYFVRLKAQSTRIFIFGRMGGSFLISLIVVKACSISLARLSSSNGRQEAPLLFLRAPKKSLKNQRLASWTTTLRKAGTKWMNYFQLWFQSLRKKSHDRQLSDAPTLLLFTHSSSSLMMSMITKRSMIARNYLSLSLSWRHSCSIKFHPFVVRSCKIPSSSHPALTYSADDKILEDESSFAEPSETQNHHHQAIDRWHGTCVCHWLNVCNRIESFKLSACVTRVQFMWQSLARWLSGHCD